MYDLTRITPERVCALLLSKAQLPEKPALKQPQLLDELRGPLEYYTVDAVQKNDDGKVVSVITAGDVIPRPFDDLVEALRELRRVGLARFTPPGASGGWVYTGPMPPPAPPSTEPAAN